MSKPRISLFAYVDTIAHADTMIGVLTNALSGKSVFELHSLERGEEEGKIYVSFEARLNVNADRDTLRNLAIDRLRDRPATRDWFLTGSTISIHTCTHDDVRVKPCTETDYVLEFEK